jgi:hypothetical protein
LNKNCLIGIFSEGIIVYSHSFYVEVLTE